MIYDDIYYNELEMCYIMDAEINHNRVLTEEDCEFEEYLASCENF